MSEAIRMAEASEVHEAVLVGLHAVEYMAAIAISDCRTFGHLLAHAGEADKPDMARGTFRKLHTDNADFLRELLDRVDALMQFAGDFLNNGEPSEDDIKATTHAFRRIARVKKAHPEARP